ncbi:bifunctional oligoribonuclease/PAP phosphatase NrnA [Spiroplasma endosymbiont of Crioceris asparagi]|uniref:DHH family phosphoesterase n=1 Tax=Spiroplasma endosymbiont of Crioceris asparagi TaxID=3066286 RepID=UPI0030D05EEC
MAKNKIYKDISNVIKKYKNIIIAKHVMPDWDAQGSAVGLAEIIKENYKDKNVFIVGDNLNKNETFDDKKLNENLIKESLLITVDVANFERIDFKFWNQANKIIKIDHHKKTDSDFGDYKLIDEHIPACTQVIFEWALAMKYKINKLAAENLFKGLVTDTGRFLYNEVNENTMIMGSKLFSLGINHVDIYSSLYSIPLNLQIWKNKMFSKIVWNKEKKYAYLIIKKEDYENIVSLENVKMCLSLMSGLKEIDLWFLGYEKNDTEIKLSLRSKYLDVDNIAKKFNGGGHKYAAGCSLNNFNDIKKVIEEIENSGGQ